MFQLQGFPCFSNNFSLFWLHSFSVLLAFFPCLLYKVFPVLLKTQIYRDFPVLVTTFLCSNYRVFPALITPFPCFDCIISLFYQHFFPCLIYRVFPVLLKIQIYRDFPVLVTTFLCFNYRVFPALITPFPCFGYIISLYWLQLFYVSITGYSLL